MGGLLADVTEDIRAKRGYLLLALGVLLADQWSKWWIERHLTEGRPLRIIDGLLSLTYVRNTGVAFGLFPARGELAGTLLLTALGFAALGVVGVYFHRTPRGERLLLTALALILGGAVGNLADRIAAGSVTDFIDVYYRSYHWHTFNVADSAITIGIGLMILEIVGSHRGARAGAAPSGNSTGDSTGDSTDALPSG